MSGGVISKMIARFCYSHGIDRVTWRHLSLLLTLTLLIQGAMYLSYPLPSTNTDDNQSAQSYLIGDLLSGNLLIGNVRYNTGYAFVMAPARALTRTLGRLDDRAFLLVQMLAYSAIPFMVYDMIGRRFDRRTAIITALVVLADPFGLQWAHFRLPEWLIALVTVWALWLAQLAWSATDHRRRLKLATLAAIGLGLMTIARLNYAPLVAVFGGSFLLWRHITARQRLSLFALVGLLGAGMLVGYILLIQIPSTGGGRLSCTTGTTLLSAAHLKGLPLLASNGPQSAYYAELLTLKDEQGATIKPGRYQYWRIPGPWVSEAAREAFFAQPIGEPEEEIRIYFPAELFSYMGPCPLDGLLFDVALEAIALNPAKYALESLRAVFNMLILHPTELAFPSQYLESPQDISFSGDGAFGIYRAESDLYNGHRVWKPGIVIFSRLFPLINLLKLLTPFAIIAACWKRDWLLLSTAALYVVSLAAIATAAIAEPRYFAMVAPLASMILGWFLAHILWRLTGGRRTNRAVGSSPRQKSAISQQRQ